MAVCIDEARGQEPPFQVQCPSTLDGSGLPFYILYQTVSHFNGRQIRSAVIYIQYIRIDYPIHHHVSTACIAFSTVCCIAVMTTSESSCFVNRLASTRTTRENA